MKARKHRKQRGGNPAILPILTAANEVAKLIKPATRLKQTRLGKAPVIGTILETLSQMGYGTSGIRYNTPYFEDASYMKRRILPIYPNQGLMSIPLTKASSMAGQFGAGMCGRGVSVLPY